MHGKIHIDRLQIDFENFRLLRDDEAIHLTRTEWALLRELMAHNHQIVTYPLLLQRVWGTEYHDESAYIHTYISRLRKKLEDDAADPRYIVTESGIGYRVDFPLSKSPIDETQARTDAPSNTPAPEDVMLAAPVETAAKAQVKTVNPLPQDVAGYYVGRETEQAELINLLLKGTRLISVYGRGGIGKTALVCKVLYDLQNGEHRTFFDGMVFLSATGTGLNLSHIFTDFKKLLPHVDITPLDTPHAGQKALVQKVTAFLDMLSDGNYILLLDNLEDIQRPGTHELADEEIETFLQVALTQGSTLRIIVTSRYPVALPRPAKVWEHVIALDEGLPQAKAITMLRNSAPDSLREIHDAAEASLALVVEKTRGFPRALQAVVGLLLEDQLLTLDDLIQDEALFSDEIETIFVENAIQRLSDEAIQVMEVLALFDNPVNLEGLEQLLQTHADAEQIRAILNRLVRGYFVNYDRSSRMFSLHPIDQAYCYSRIPQGNLQDKFTSGFNRYTLHRLAAEYYTEKSDLSSILQTYEDIQPHLNEFKHRVGAGEYNRAAEIILALDEQLYLWGYYTRLNDLYTQLIDHVDEKANLVRLRLGEAKRSIGQVNDALELYEQVLEKSKDEQELGIAHNKLGWANYDLGQFDEAIVQWQEAYDLFVSIDYAKGMAEAQGGIGWVSYLNGDYTDAIEYFTQALDSFRNAGDRYGEGSNMGDLGAVYSAMNNYDAAIDHLRKSLKIAAELGAQREQNHKGGYLATALLMAEQPDKALEAVITARKFDVPTNQYTVTAIHGVILTCLNRADEAKQAFSETIKYADTLLQHSKGLYQARYARALALAGLSLLEDGDFEKAAADYDLATTLCSTAGVIESNLKLLNALAKCKSSKELDSLRQILLKEMKG